MSRQQQEGDGNPTRVQAFGVSDESLARMNPAKNMPCVPVGVSFAIICETKLAGASSREKKRKAGVMNETEAKAEGNGSGENLC